MVILFRGEILLGAILFRGNPILALVVLDIVFFMRGVLLERRFAREVF